MFLIHAALRAPAPGVQLPSATAEFIRYLPGAEGLVEHVSAHPGALPDPVVGVYVLADGLAEAERRTEDLCRRALAEVRALRGWRVTRVGVPLVAPYYEQLLQSSSGRPGRIGTGPFPST